MPMTLIQQYASSLIRGAADQAKVLDGMDHGTTKGRYREIFVKDVLSRFLTAQFGIGSGIIVNQRGDQSSQQDVVIFDRRVLPPFLDAEGLGVFPIESVLATIEVKSTLSNQDIRQTETSARQLEEMASGSIYCERLCPSASVIGYRSDEYLTCRQPGENGATWLSNNASRLFGVTVIGEISWLKLNGWESQTADGHFEETKTLVAVLCDILRSAAEHRMALLSNGHKDHRDWLSVYTRFNCSGSKFLRGETDIFLNSTTSSTTTTTTLPLYDPADWRVKTPEPNQQSCEDICRDPACFDPCKFHER